MHLGSFLKVKVQNEGCILGLLKFQIFLGVLEIPDIFWVNGRCWARARVPVPPPEGDGASTVRIVCRSRGTPLKWVFNIFRICLEPGYVASPKI